MSDPTPTDPVPSERPKAVPQKGTILTIHHAATREQERTAICRNCGGHIENGWGYWVHSDSPNGREFCV